RGDLPRKVHGAGASRGRHWQPIASIQRGPDVGRAHSLALVHARDPAHRAGGRDTPSDRSPVRMPLPDALPARSAALGRRGAGMAGTAAPPLGRLPFRQRARPSARGGESALIPAHEWAARAAPEPEPEPSTRRTEMKASMTTATQLMAAPMTRREWLL